MTRDDVIDWACANAIDGVTITRLTKRAGQRLKHGVRIDPGTFELDLLLLTEDGEECKRLLYEHAARFLKHPTDATAEVSLRAKEKS